MIKYIKTERNRDGTIWRFVLEDTENKHILITLWQSHPHSEKCEIGCGFFDCTKSLVITISHDIKKIKQLAQVIPKVKIYEECLRGDKLCLTLRELI